MRVKQIILIGTITFILFFQFNLFTTDSVSAAPYINVESPSSGDTVYTGESYTITWNAGDLDGNYVRIELYKNGSLEQTIRSYEYNDGSYSWYVSSSLDESDYYRIKISDYYNSSTYDYSGYFSIKIPRSITVTTPYSSSTWYKNDNAYIRWNSQNAGSYVFIDLYKNSVKTRTISSYTYNDGSFYWSIPSDLTLGADYQIKITSYSYTTVHDYSNEFPIDERTITVTSPEQGDVWFKEEEYKIIWDSKNAGTAVRLELYENGYYKSSIDSYETNDGEYTWTVSTALSDTSTYKIRVRSTSYSIADDYSGEFSIDERSLSFSTAFNGKIWFPNETHMIEWDSENAGSYVEISLYRNNIYSGAIASNISNSGTYTWSISNIFPAGDGYTMRIRSLKYKHIKDESEEFSIGGREVAVEKPEKDSTWYIGESYKIKWDSSNVGEYVNIVLYKDGKPLWNIASNAKGSTGYYDWDIPTNLSEDDSYQIRVESTSFSNVSSMSEKFSIEKTLMEKMSLPLMIIIGTIVTIISIVGIVTFIKKRRNRPKDVEEEQQISYKSFEQKGIIKSDNSQKDYDDIWEGKKS